MLQLSVLASHLLFLGCLQLKALGTEGMIKELIQSLHLAEDMFSCRRSFPNTSIYNTVLHSLVEAEEVNTSYNLVIMLYRCYLLSHHCLVLNGDTDITFACDSESDGNPDVQKYVIMWLPAR